MERTPRFFLIDGSSYSYRAFYAVPALSTSKGLPTNAVFGFSRMLLKILRRHGPEWIVVVFDAPGRTFRDEMYREYKATRPAVPEDLVRQIPYLRAVSAALRLETLEVPGVEADDVIGTLARRAVEKGVDAVVVGADKDFMQLVTRRVGDPGPGITLYDDSRDRFLGVDEVRERFGVDPGRVVDVLALAGDTSDNIPGVRGLGPKFAARLVAEYGSVEDLLSNLDRVAPRFRALLEAGREEALLSKKLAAIRCDLDLAWDPERFRRREPDRERLAELFRELEFSRLLEETGVGAVARAAVPAGRYRLVLSGEDLGRLAGELRGSGTLAFDVETTSPDPMRARLVGISLCAREGEAFYIPVGHRYLGAPPQLPLSEVLAALRPLLTDPGLRKVGQNVTYDALVLRRHGVEVAPLAFDTMVGAYLVNPDDGPFNLETLARRWLSMEKPSFEEVVGRGRAQVTFDQVPVERARDYSCADADAVFRLAPLLEERVRRDGLGPVLDEIEIPLLGVLVDLEQNGVRIDTAVLGDLGREFDKRISQAAREAYRAAGREFNLDSPRQLQRILFEDLKLSPGRRTKTGLSTDMAVLERLASEHELPARVLEYRSLAKLKNTYIDALPGLVHPETGRLHTSYNQAVAATGRLTSSEPNLQNIPVRTPEGRLIRRAFVPEDGWVFVGADYSQIELRVLAHLSGDERLLAAFRGGEDIHSATARELFGGSDEESRRRAKAVNFGIIYGMSAYGLGQRLGIDPRRAQEIIDSYFARYRGVRAWIDASLEQARKDGFVRTLFGRRRYVPDLGSGNRGIRSAAERVAINAPIQGTAADLMKKAMIAVSRRLRGKRARLILQVHDELVLEAPEDEAVAVGLLLREAMEGVASLRVPLRVDLSRGPNWADMT